MRRLLAALGFALAALPAFVTPTAGAMPAQETDEDTPAPVEAALVDRSPWIAPEGAADFVVRTANLPEDATVRLTVHTPLRSVDGLERSATTNVGQRLFVSPRLPVDTLGRRDDDLVVTLKTSEGPADEFTARLRRPGVYPLVISIQDPGGSTIGEVRTPVIRLGHDDSPIPAPRLGILLDIGAPPTLQPDGTRVLDRVWTERIEGVSELLAAHPDLGLSIAAVPDTLDALAVAVDPVPATLATRVMAGEPLLLPYVPVAAESLRTTDLIGLLPELLTRGRDTLRAATDHDPLEGIWDPAASFGAETAEILAGLGYDHVLVDFDQLAEPTDGEDVVDDAPMEHTLDDGLVDAGPIPLTNTGSLDAVVVDTALSDWLARAPSEGVDAPHVALAELLLRDDGTESDLLVRATPAPRSVLADLLALLDRPDAPIVVGGIELLLDDPPPRDDAEQARLEWTGEIRPDLSGIADRVLAVMPVLDTFAATIEDRSTRADDLRLQLATAVAATTPSERRVAAIDIIEATVNDAFAAIRLAGRNDVNLTSRRGTLPITIENANDFAAHVVLRVRSDRLAFPDGEVLTLDIPPESTRIDIPVEALATGSVPVFVELWTVDDRVQLDDRQLNIRSTAISGVGLALSLGALAVLAGWWIRSWRRHRSSPEPERSETPTSPLG